MLYSGSDIIKIKFNSSEEVLHHMKSLGVNALSEKFWTKSDLKKFLSTIMADSIGGSIFISYNPLYFILQKEKDR